MVEGIVSVLAESMTLAAIIVEFELREVVVVDE
jgi:hypothetical protein